MSRTEVGARKSPVGLEEADREEEGLRGGLQRLDGDRGHVLGVVAVDLDHLVVADHRGVLEMCCSPISTER